MNKLFKGLLLAVLFASMCACSSDENSTSSQVETSELHLSLFDSEVESFNNTRAVEDVGTSFDQLDIAIIPIDKTTNSKEFRVQQNSGDDDFGHLSVKLPIGKYTLVAVASKKGEMQEITSPTSVSFSNVGFSDMASVSQAIDLKSGSNAVNAVLKRCFTKLLIKSTDCVEKNVAKVVVTYMGKFSKTYNPATGLGIVDGEEMTFTKNITPRQSDTPKPMSIGLTAFIPEETVSWVVDVKLYDANEMIVKELHFDDVKMQQNHITTYSGPLFTTGSTFGFSFDNTPLAEGYKATFD